ncbi:MAG TPA: M20 family metallopeptidase [Solirubrobacteraceae bacterium]|jgi:amidohydrolase|nr:M20 family metallopeptidase [Solirubrobacteraceae bacterium]
MQRSIEAFLGELLSGIEQELEHAVELRHRLHAHPELAHAEEWTAATVAHELPVESLTAAGTGRLVRIGSAVGRPIAVRAELDGLPIEERTDVPYRAAGGVMHACGHDVHMAALVAVTRAAHALADSLPAPLVAIFQPSEEAYPSGAEQLAREELPRIVPAAVLAAHVHPELPWGTVAIDPGTVNASSDNFEITIEGEPSHGAYPHRGRDSILAMAHVIVALHSQAARRIDPLRPAVLNIGVVEGGAAENVIAAEARARGSLRAHRAEDRIALRRMVEEVVTSIAAAHGCRGRTAIIAGEPALCNDPAIATRARELLSRAGLQVAAEWRSCGSDDFAFFGELAPLAMGFVGLDGAPGFTPRPLHHPELLPPDGAVAAVARVQAILYAAAASSLAQPD